MPFEVMCFSTCLPIKAAPGESQPIGRDATGRTAQQYFPEEAVRRPSHVTNGPSNELQDLLLDVFPEGTMAEHLVWNAANIALMLPRMKQVVTLTMHS
jgi:hypothetical protein